ncbi:MAG: hypothetical protein H6P95_394 [Candidatus Aminicenantes bacterium]|nr:hypothetical protein [Candidatus Aminicenantes bacterium]
MPQAVEIEPPEQLFGLPARRRGLEAGDPAHEQDILLDRELGQQIGALEDEADGPGPAAPVRRPSAAVERPAVEKDLAGLGREDPPGDGQQRRLPRSARPFEEDELPGFDRQRHPMQHLDLPPPRAPGLPNIVQDQGPHERNASSGSIALSRTTGARAPAAPVRMKRMAMRTTSRTEMRSGIMGMKDSSPARSP